MDEPYRVEVLHIVNPHLIFVESQLQRGVPIIQQVGIYGLLPVFKTIDINGELIAERCENWPIAANTILREFFAEHKHHVYFLPIHVDERSTIFDESVHRFGDIIIKHRTTMSIADQLVELAVAVRDETAFHAKLSSGSLKLKLNTTRTEEVLTSIEKYYKRQRRVDHDWQTTIKQQTSLHQETKKITALTEENLKLLERSSRVNDVKEVMETVEQKAKDFNLCKDADLVSVGCGSRRSKMKPTSVPSPKPSEDKNNGPHEMFSSLQRFLITHGKKKTNNIHSTLKSDTDKKLVSKKMNNSYEEQTNMLINNSMDSDDEWDSIEDFSKTNRFEELDKSDQLRQDQGKKPHPDHSQNKQCQSQEQEHYTQDEQNENQKCEEQDISLILNSNEGRDNDQSNFEKYQVKTKSRNDFENNPKQKTNLLRYETDEDMRNLGKQASKPLKPKERRLVYCPDMEMSTSNLKNLIALTVNENSLTNYANTVEEVPGNKTGLGELDYVSNVYESIVKDRSNEEYFNVCDNIVKGMNALSNKTRGDNFDYSDCSNVTNKISQDTSDNKAESQKSHSSIKVIAKNNTVTNGSSRLKMSVVERKLQALRSMKKRDENDSISSSSDVDGNQKEPAPQTFETKKVLETAYTDSHSETKNTRSNLTKTNRLLSSTILQKKLQVLKDSRQRMENSSSTSDTSVKDTSSSTEQSKIEQAESHNTKIQLESLKVDLQPKPAQNIAKAKRNVNPFKNLDGSKSVFVEKLVTPILMVHTKNNNLILPQCEIRDVPFKPDIRMMLKSMRVHKPKRLQTVTWAYILRGNSMFIVGPAGNGKTVGYVPAVCNLVLDSPTKSEGVGPICIIVCATALSVSEVESHCKRFLGVEERIVTFFPGIDATKTATALLNGCHVLICTAPALVNLLETDFGVDLRRLAILVFDDCERMSQMYATELSRIVQNVKVMLKNRADKALKVQYIVASRQWCDFMTPLAKKAPDSVIAIGASQECVLYSKTRTSVNFVKDQANKVRTVVEFLEEIDRTKKTVIVCRDDNEVVQLEITLSSQKHVVFACNSTMTLYDLCRLNEAWANYEEPLLGPILICCDGNLAHLNITNANYLVHFSLPPLFSMFCKRFSVLNENYASIFGPEKDDVKIKILLDETNVEQLPKILHFVERCTKEAFPNLSNVLQEVLEAKDLKKAKNLQPLCNNLLALGECADIWNCSDRHTVFQEFDEPKVWMPKQGLITFKITHYDSAVTYSARVLAKITKSGLDKYPNNYNTLALKMGMHYSKEVNRKLHGVPKVGDICAVALKQNFFERCRVMKVIPSDAKNINHVLITLIEEEQMTVVSDVLLYHLPNDLKAIETHVVKVRLANIQPKDRDVTFSLAAKEHLQKLTDREREHGLYMRGQVVMTIGNTIFVDTAEACVDLSSLSETVVKQDFKKELLDCHAEPNPQHIEKLKKISGILNTIDINEPKMVPKVQKCPKWAHLDKDEFSTMIFAAVIDAGTIFLRHAKFQKVVDFMLKDIKEYVEKAPEIDQAEIYVGNIILAEFPDDAVYERARIDDIVNDKIVKCFFVDNGDRRQVPVNKLKPITENIMHHIPFQAIECRLVGVMPPGNADAWPEFSTYWLDDNCFEDKDGVQKQIFVKYFTKETATLTGGYKYGVVVFDTYSEEDIVINKMMIELNLAKVIEDEEKYIDEPLTIKRVTMIDSPSDSDENVTQKDDSIKVNGTPIIKDLVPIQPKVYEKNENDIPLHILLGKPIRSVPLVNSDSESDVSDKWDVNVDKNMIGMFGQPSKANIIENNNTNEEKDTPLQKTKTDDTLEKNNVANTLENTKKADKSERDIEGDSDTKNEKKESSIAIVSSNLKKENTRSQLMSPSLDSDDIDTPDERITAVNVFERKMSTEDIIEKLNTKTGSDVTLKANDTLDSDDLSVANETFVAPIAKTDDRKPKLVWRQNKSTVAIKINMIGVEDYTLEIKERHIQFQSCHNDTNYGFELELHGVVVPSKSLHSNKGQYILVRLVKMLSRNWLSLTKDFSNKKWVVYDVDAIEFTSDEDERNDDEARKVIKHNHEKAESSSDDDFADDTELKYKRY